MAKFTKKMVTEVVLDCLLSSPRIQEGFGHIPKDSEDYNKKYNQVIKALSDEEDGVHIKLDEISLPIWAFLESGHLSKADLIKSGIQISKQESKEWMGLLYGPELKLKRGVK